MIGQTFLILILLSAEPVPARRYITTSIKREVLP
jgi:hypothetical protein